MTPSPQVAAQTLVIATGAISLLVSAIIGFFGYLDHTPHNPFPARWTGITLVFGILCLIVAAFIA